MTVTLPDTASKQAIASIRRYFEEVLEQDIGDLKAQLFLEFVLKEIGPSIYNSAIDDAQAYMRDRVADLEDVSHKEEFVYWPKASSVRRKRGASVLV
jgi:uncharacterized protein (DUF2164 family)